MADEDREREAERNAEIAARLEKAGFREEAQMHRELLLAQRRLKRDLTEAEEPE